MKPLPYIIAGATGAIVATVLPMFISNSQAEPRLLPFQGRLTDAAGAAVSDGARLVEFKMYDAPTGGNVKWAGEVHKLSVNGGLVNTMLGSKASLGSVDFAGATFLQITVDANGDGAITAADPPLLPRQSVVGAVYASVAGEIQYATANGVDSVAGSTLFNTDGKLKTTNLAADNGITAGQLANGAVGTDELGTGSVTAAKLNADVAASLLVQDSVTSTQIKNGEVKTGEIADGAATTAKLAGSVVGGVETIAGAVTSEKIKDGTIQERDIADQAITPAKMKREIIYFVEEKNSNEAVAAPVGWSTRQLNKQAFATSGFASLGANGVVTLQPGKYLIEATASSNGADGGMIILRDVAGDSTLVAGSESTGRYILVSYVINSQNKGLLRGVIEVIGGPKVVDLQQYAAIVAYPSSSYGSAGGTGMGVKGAKWIASSMFIEKLN